MMPLEYFLLFLPSLLCSPLHQPLFFNQPRASSSPRSNSLTTSHTSTLNRPPPSKTSYIKLEPQPHPPFPHSHHAADVPHLEPPATVYSSSTVTDRQCTESHKSSISDSITIAPVPTKKTRACPQRRHEQRHKRRRATYSKRA